MKASVAAIVIGTVLGASAPVWATDIINQDSKSYQVTVVDGGYTAKYTVKANSSQYGVCGTGPCTFKIKGSSVTAAKDARLVINKGKLSKM
jgi:hypothetical protein